MRSSYRLLQRKVAKGVDEQTISVRYVAVLIMNGTEVPWLPELKVLDA
jgi:hypothetical protein